MAENGTKTPSPAPSAATPSPQLRPSYTEVPLAGSDDLTIEQLISQWRGRGYSDEQIMRLAMEHGLRLGRQSLGAKTAPQLAEKLGISQLTMREQGVKDGLSVFVDSFHKMQDQEQLVRLGYINNWNSLQQDQLEAAKSPYKMIGSFGSMMAGLGAIVSVFDANIGQKMMAGGIMLGKQAQEGILSVEGDIRKEPEGYKSRMDTVYNQSTLNAIDLLIQNGLDPEYVRQYINQASGALDGVGKPDRARQLRSLNLVGIPDNDRSGKVGLVKPYDDKQIKARADLILKPSKFDPLFDAAERMYGLPKGDLKTVAVAESMLNPKALGEETRHGRAKGLMQIIDSTARAYGVEDAFDAPQAVFGMARFRADLYAQHRSSDKVDAYYYGMPGGNPTADTLQYQANMKTLRRVTTGQEIMTVAPGQIKLADRKGTVTEDTEQRRVAQLNGIPTKDGKADEKAPSAKPADAKAPLPKRGGRYEPQTKGQPKTTTSDAVDHIEPDTQVAAASEVRNVDRAIEIADATAARAGKRAYDTEVAALDVTRKAKGGEVRPRADGDVEVQRDFRMARDEPKPRAGGDVYGHNQRAEMHARNDDNKAENKDKGPKPVVSPLAIYAAAPQPGGSYVS